MNAYKVRHKTSGRFLNGSNYSDALRLTGKTPIGKIWHSYDSAYKYAQTWELFNSRYIQPGELEVVEYAMLEAQITQVRQ